MKNNSSFDNIADTFEKLQSLSGLSQDKNKLLELFLDKKPELSPILSAINMSKGGISSLISASQPNSDITSLLLPLLLSTKSTTQNECEDSHNKNHTPKKGEFLSPIAKIASGDILKEIMLIIE